MTQIKFLTKGEEWITIQDIDDEQCLWLYGEGVVGNYRAVCPISVKDSQIKAHISKGWITNDN